MSGDQKDFAMLLGPSAAALVLLDHQDDFLTGLSPSVRDALSSDTLALTKVARACGVPVVLSSLASETFRGATLPSLREIFPKTPEVQREHLGLV